MATLKQLLIFLVSIVSFIYTLYVVGCLMLFLSRPSDVPKHFQWIFNLLDNKSKLQTAYGPVVFDALYVIGFMFQHSFMKSSFFKNLLDAIGLSSAERAIYSLTSSYCLHHLIANWISAKSIILWQVDVEGNALLWWSFIIVHSLAWLVIYGGSIIMDLPDIIGVKQAYYDLKGLSPPSSYKTIRLQHLNSHVRHPSFIGLSVVLWATNLMTIDRLLLAMLLTTYMYLGWSTDSNDLKYQEHQFQRKREELKSI